MSFEHLISENTVSYLLQQFPEETPKWLSVFDSEVTRISQKWKLVLSGHERNSRFGTILYGTSEFFGDVAVKIVPAFSPRLKSEIFCYRQLPYREMCPLYDVDEPLGAMLLRYVSPSSGNNAPHREAVFRRLYEERRIADDQTARVLPRYENVLEDVLKNARNVVTSSSDEKLNAFLPSITRSEASIRLFDRCERYIIHGDAHEYNMLMDGENCVLIDPLGYVAPFEIEYARYLGTAMKFTQMSADEFFSLLKRILPESADLRAVLTAFAIDTTLRGCNTFIEGNTYDEICFGADWARRAWAYADALIKA